MEPSEFKNKITNHLDNNDTLEIGTDDTLDKVNGSDCGGNSYCDKREAFKEGGPLTNFTALYSSIP